MSTHAYGPWQVHAPAPQRTFVVRRDERDAVFIVAELWNNGQDEQSVIANARMMAAAPEMLETLQKVARYLGQNGHGSLPQEIRAAIAQAEGSPPPGRTQ